MDRRGRRSGKDSIASGVAAWISGIEQSHLGRLRPGELASVLCIATDREQARIVKSYAESYFEAIDDLHDMVTRETRAGLELNNAAEIIVSTNSFRQARGRAVLLALLDECATYRDETSANPDVEVYRAIVPGMATLPGSMLLGFSSPYRKAGLLYDKWKAHFGRDDDRDLVIQAASTQLNPTLDPEIVAEALAADPAAARAEWLGEFRDDVGGYVSLELIEAAVDYGVTVRPPRPGVNYLGFVDVASGTGRDSFAVAIAHACDDGCEAILDLAHEIVPPFNPQSAVDEICAILRNYGVHDVRGDRYAAGFALDAFARNGVTLEYSEKDRSAIYIDALPLFTSGRARLVDNKKLVTQFASLERRTSPSGKDRVDHGSGQNSHDDLCNAAAGALALIASDDADPGHWRALARSTAREEAELAAQPVAQSPGDAQREYLAVHSAKLDPHYVASAPVEPAPLRPLRKGEIFIPPPRPAAPPADPSGWGSAPPVRPQSGSEFLNELIAIGRANRQ